jgi:glutathione S-transferase
LQETFGAVPLSNVASITASAAPEKFMLTVHHLGVSQSERIVWLCEELELPYELKLYKRTEVGAAPPEYKALHPVGAAPVISDGDVLLAESGAVMEYILGRYGEGRLVIRPEQPGYADYLYWLHFANGSMMPAEMVNLVASRLGPDAQQHPLLQWRRASSDASFAMVDRRLQKTAYFAGGVFTAADIMMLFPLTTMRQFSRRDISGLPALCDYLQRIAARPAYQRAMAKGDPGVQPFLS